MKPFRHKITGKVDYFPEHFAAYEFMELVESDDVPCCGGDEVAFLKPIDNVGDVEPKTKAKSKLNKDPKKEGVDSE